ncbi:MAG: hypothetical protein MJE68_11915, partial [Proteobacteria bacterium]|nr:hypothetical protein [Pseudomonadota bacterium]
MGVLLSAMCPFLISCIPFINDMYGISGPWCWIRTIGDDDCLDSDLQKFGLSFILITFSPQLFCLIFGPLGVVAIMVSYLRVPKNLYGNGRRRYQNGIKFIGVVFLYTIIYSLLSLLPWANQVYVSYTLYKNHPPNYLFWIMRTVADPSRILMLILAMLMNPDVQKAIRILTRKYYLNVVTDDAPTIPTSRRISPPLITTYYNPGTVTRFSTSFGSHTDYVS